MLEMVLLKKDVKKMNKKIKDILCVDEIYTCFHSQKDNCPCRKPKIALFEKANKKYNIDKTKSYMIGDRFSDIEAGISFDIKTILLGDGYGEKNRVLPSHYIDRLDEILDII